MASRAQNGLPSLEFALRFLLGERGDLLDSGGKLGKGTLVVEDDDDDEGEEVIRGGLNLTASQTLGRNINVPPPRRGGAIFGPRGKLFLLLFPYNVRSLISSTCRTTNRILPYERLRISCQ